MRDLGILFIHLLITVVKLMGPGGSRAVVAESLIVKHQRLSSPGELHPEALADPDVNVSAHPAPIIQPTNRPCITHGFLPFQVDPQVTLNDATPLLCPHYQASTLLRVAPPLCAASVLSILWR